nr:zinc finger, CCHC-type [Tanacetum cinerariifolium]
MTSTRSDIAYAVGRLSRFSSNPGRHHWHAITRVLKYLKGTMNYGLSYFGYPFVLEGYLDASWINHVEDSSSTSGWLFLLGGGAISWASKKKTCITSSTMKSEFIGCCCAATLAKAYSQIYNGTGSMHELHGFEFEVEPLRDHTFEVQPQENVNQGAGLQEVQTQDLMDYLLARDREQHLACELFKYREDSIEAAFVVAVVDKIYVHESLTFNDTVAFAEKVVMTAMTITDARLRSGLPKVCWLKQREMYLNLFPLLDNPELTIQKRSRVDPTLLNDFEMATEGNGDPSVLDLRTMKELCQPTLNGQGGPISTIAIQAMNFGLKNYMIQQVQNSCQFHGLPGDDANKHLDKFLHVTQSIKVNEVTDEPFFYISFLTP